MTEAPAGRDVFVAGCLTPGRIATLFGEAFGVGPEGVILAEASEQQWLASLDQRSRIVIHALEPEGDFGFKLAIDLDVPIVTARLAALAREGQLTIAWAVDETSPRDDYQVAFSDGRMAVHSLQFRETEESYACMFLPASDSSHDA